MALRNLKHQLAWRQVGLYLLGIVLLMAFFEANADTSQQDHEKAQIPIWIQDPYTGDAVLTSVSEPNTSLWNAKRIEDYEASLKVDTAPPLGILTIEKLDIRVPIYNGTDDLTLDRGAGRIKGMAQMDEVGNLGISGHRDGFFRGLKDIQVGDDIELQTTSGVRTYEVTKIKIIPKEDVSVLEPTEEKILTIVTCYPFYFVGNAPKRYIVTAVPKYLLAKE
jgi:LPXTG-site transpeptidase (sortase) family protein